MKNMNRLIRIYGLNRRHCLHELTGSMTAVSLQQVGARRPSCGVTCMYPAMDKRTTTILRLGVITLQHDKGKDCDRHPPHDVRVQVGQPGKVCLDMKGV